MRGVLLEPGCGGLTTSRGPKGCLGRGWWRQQRQQRQQLQGRAGRRMRWERRSYC